MPIASDFDTFTWRYYKNGGGKIDVSLDIAIKYILESENIKDKSSLDVWCGKKGRKKLYEAIKDISNTHWSRIQHPEASIRARYEKCLSGYKYYSVINDAKKSDNDNSNKQGCNKYGYNHKGEWWYNLDGYDIDGYDANGYDINGYDIDGYDIDGYDVNGKHKIGIMNEDLYPIIMDKQIKFDSINIGDMVSCICNKERIYSIVIKVNRTGINVKDVLFVNINNRVYIIENKKNLTHKGTLGFSRYIELCNNNYKLYNGNVL